MAGTWLDWTIVVVGCIVLLPRLLAYAVNTSLVRWLQSVAARAGVSLDLELGSLSLRQLCDVSVRAGRWRLPQHPNLYASVEVQVDAIGLYLCGVKPLTAKVRGARFVVVLEAATPADREREREQDRISEMAKIDAAAAAGKQASSSATSSSGTGCAEIHSHTVLRAASSLKESVVHATATADLPISWKESAARWCVLQLMRCVAVSLQGAEVCVRKGDVQVSLELGFSMWFGDGSLQSSRQIHVNLHGLAVRVEQLRTHEQFRKSASYNPLDERWRMPPLLAVLPTEVAVDIHMQRCIPVSLEGLDVQCRGIEVAVDPALQLQTLQQAALEFHEQIKDLSFHLPPTAPATPSGGGTPRLNERGIGLTSPSPIASAISAHGSGAGGVDSPVVSEDALLCASHKRQFALRFLPKHIKIVLDHFKVEMIQRGDAALHRRKTTTAASSAASTSSSSAAAAASSAAASSASTKSNAATSSAGLRHRGVGAKLGEAVRPHSHAGSSGSAAASSSMPSHATTAASAAGIGANFPPILHVLLLRFNKVSILTSIKTAYPVVEAFSGTGGGESGFTAPEENIISSVDWSVNMAGPSIWMSQQGMVHPRLDVEYCKFTGHSAANFTHGGGAHAGVGHTPHSTHAATMPFPLGAPLQASAGAVFTSPLASSMSSSHLGASSSSSHRRSRGRSLGGGSSPAGGVVNSLFHPTTAYRPQTVHALTFVCVSLRMHIFPSCGEWSRYIIGVVWQMQDLVASLPLPKAPVPAVAAASATPAVHTPSSESSGAAPAIPPRPSKKPPMHHSAGSGSSTSSASSSIAASAPSGSVSAAGVTSPDSYLRQMISPSSSWATAGALGVGIGGNSPASASPSGAGFPQFPFANNSAGAGAGAKGARPRVNSNSSSANSLSVNAGGTGDDDDGFPPARGPTPSPSPLPPKSLTPLPPAVIDDPYAVQTAITINLKVVDVHLAVYPTTGDAMPLCHLSISEASMRYDIKPPALQNVLLQPLHQPHSDGRMRLNSALDHARPMWLPASERIEVVVSGFVGALPKEVNNPLALLPHPNEAFCNAPRGRFWQLNTATLIVDKSSADIIFNADGLAIRWSVQALLAGPPIVGMIIGCIPTKPAPPKTGPKSPKQGSPTLSTGSTAAAASASSSHTEAAAAAAAAAAVEIRFVKGTLTNLTVDFPYLLEFRSDALHKKQAEDKARKASNAVAAEKAAEAVAESINSSPGTVLLDVLSPPARMRSRLSRSPPLPESGSNSQQEQKSTAPPPPSINTRSSPSPAASPKPDTTLRPEPSPSPSPSPSPGGSAGCAPAQQRATSLFTYKSSIVNLDVDIPRDAWSLLLYQSTCLSEGDTFLTLLNASLSGAEKAPNYPKSMNVTADQVVGSWRPALQLGIFKVVKDCVAAAISFKYGLCIVVPRWRKFCWPQGMPADALHPSLKPAPEAPPRDQYQYPSLSVLDLEAKKLADRVEAAAWDADDAEHEARQAQAGLNYSSDPMLAALGTKATFLAAFRHWYHHIRARHLPEPFMFVTLHSTNLTFDAALNREETLGCTIRLDEFSSKFVPHHFAFVGVEVDFMKKPIIVVKELNLTRMGIPDLTPRPDVILPDGSRVAARHALMDFTEEHNLLANYLDLRLLIRDCRMEIAPTLDIGSVLATIGIKIQALVKGILDLPSLDQLSRRTDGPGYAGCPYEPPPALLLDINAFQFEVVDGPFESWLQHLHLLWLDERSEQERRRALLRVKIETMRKEGLLGPAPKSSAAVGGEQPLTAIEQAMNVSLSEWNSRSYYSRVNQLKQSFRGSDSLKQAPLLNATIARMVCQVGLDGRYGNFYNPENVLRVVRARKQEEEQGWHEMAKRRQAQEEAAQAAAADGEESTSSFNRSSREDSGARSPALMRAPSDSPPFGSSGGNGSEPPDLLLASSLSSNSSSSSAAAAAAVAAVAAASAASSSASAVANLASESSGPRIGFLSGRYFQVNVEDIQVRLRNFPLPLVSCAEASMAGHAAMVQVKHGPPAGAAGASSAPNSSPGHQRGASEPMADARPVQTSESAAVSIGGVHTVAVETKYRPFQLFYDLEGSVSKASVSFSPCFMYTLRDVIDALDRVVPPLPELHPIQPIPGMIGLGNLGLPRVRKKGLSAAQSAAAALATEADKLRAQMPNQQEIEAVNYIHLFRGILHGRFALTVKDTEIKLLATNDPYESSKYLCLRAGLCKLSFEKSIMKLEVQQINAISMPSRPHQPYLMELPQVELHTTIMWVCAEVPLHPTTACVHGSGPLGTGPIQPPTPGKARNRTRHLSMLPLHITTQLSEQSMQQPAASSSSSSFSAGGAMSSPPRADRSLEPAVCSICSDGEMQHVCNMHISLSCYLSAHTPFQGPLSVTLHSGTLASLVQFGQIYTAIPPLPFPRRTPLTRIDANTHPSLMVKPLSDILRDQRLAAGPAHPQQQQHRTPVHSPHPSDADSEGESPGRGKSLLVRGRDAASMESASSSALPFAFFPPNNINFNRLASVTPLVHGISQTSASVWKPKAQRVALSGLYLERILLEKLHVTIWEGADLGPARGLRIAIEHVYLALELQEEPGLTSASLDQNLRQSKLCFPFAKVHVDDRNITKLLGLAMPNASPHGSLSAFGGENSFTRGSPRGGSNILPPSASMAPATSAAGAPAGPAMIFWSLSNLICGLSKMQGLLVYNEKWQELSLDESASGPKSLDSFFGGSRVVMHSYENQRYALGLGWSSRNLLPTDRAPWTNEKGTSKLPREDVRLPSDDWEWESDWHLDFQLRRSGEVDEEGWEYAHDFPRKYSRVRAWWCNVRRRRWIRVRNMKAHTTKPEDGSTRPVGSGPGLTRMDSGRCRRALHSENSENFVMSLARVAMHQKQHQHSSDLAMLILDRERSLFRLITTPVFNKVKTAAGHGSGRSSQAHAHAHIQNLTLAHRSGDDLLAGLECSPSPEAMSPPADAGRTDSSGKPALQGGSLLNYFHIPVVVPAAVVVDQDPVSSSGVHNVHHLSEPEFVEAQLAQEELKKLHATTSSIVTVGAGLSVNPSLVGLHSFDEDDADLDRPKSVRFNKECVLDATRAARRKKSVGMAAEGSAASLARSTPLPCHSLRLHDFKLLLTIEIRSTLITLIDQYAATAMAMIEKQQHSVSQQKYTKRGRLLSLGDDDDVNSRGSDERSSMDVTLDDSAAGGGVSPSDLRHSVIPEYPDHSKLQVHSPTGIGMMPPSPRSQQHAGHHLDPSAHGGDHADTPLTTRLARAPSINFGRDGGGGTMEDLLREAEIDDEKVDVVGENIPASASSSARRKQSVASPSRGRVDSAASPSSLHPDAVVPPPEVFELFLLEVINPQINVHSEETRGRILFMTQKLSLHGRVHFKSVRENTGHSGATSPSVVRRVLSPSRTISSRDSLSPPPITWVSKCDKFLFTAMVDELQAFVAPTDVDVDAGVIWYSSATAGILKSIMQRASFFCSVTFRPELPFITTSEMQDKNAARAAATAAASASSAGGRSMDGGSLSMAPAPVISKATQHMAHHSAISSPADDSGGGFFMHASGVRHMELHSLDLKLPELVLCMDSYQFALFLDVMKTMTSPLPIQAMQVTGGLGGEPAYAAAGQTSAEDAAAVDDEYSAARVMDAVSTLPELKAKTLALKIKLTILEWEMRNLEWILSGVSNLPNKAAQLLTDLADSDSVAKLQHGKSNSGSDSASSSSLVAATTPPTTSKSLSNISSFNAWLTSTSSKFQKSDTETACLILHTRFHDFLREHSRMSGHYLNSVLAIRLRALDSKPQIQLQNVELKVLLSKIGFNLLKQEKCFLSVYVEGLSLDAHLYDDSSADFQMELMAFGARNCMPAYLNPALKEYGWAELVTPLVSGSINPRGDGGERDELSPDASGAGAFNATGSAFSDVRSCMGSTSHRYHSDNMFAAHGVKREEIDVLTGVSTVVVQHLELNVHPLQIKLTYDTLAALNDFFIEDQKKFNVHFNAPPVGGGAGGGAGGLGNEGDDGEQMDQFALAQLKSKKKYNKLKSKFLPAGGILDQTSAGATQAGSAKNAPSASPGGKPTRGLLDAIKHSRVISVAKEFYHAHSPNSTAGGGPPSCAGAHESPLSECNNEEEPSSSLRSPQPVRSMRASSMSSCGSDDSLAALDSRRQLEYAVVPAGSSKDAAALAAASARKDEESKAAARPWQFVYVRLGSTLINVSYWGGKNQANVEDFQGLGIKLKQILIQKKLWTVRKFGEQLKKELLRNLLGQVSTTLGGFLSYKMGFRSNTAGPEAQQKAAAEEEAAASAAAKEKQSSLHKMAAAMHLSRAKKTAAPSAAAGAIGPIDETASDDDADGPAGGGVPTGSAQAGSESSLLLAHQLEGFGGGIDDAEAAQEELHVKSLLFGAPKTTKSGGGLLSFFTDSHHRDGSHKERDRAAEKDAQQAREKAHALAVALEKQAQKDAALHHGSSALGSSSRRSVILASGLVLPDPTAAAGSPSPSAPSSVPPSPLRPVAAALGRPQTLPSTGAGAPISLPPSPSPQPHSLQPQQQVHPAVAATAAASPMPPAIPARPPMIPPRPSLVPSHYSAGAQQQPSQVAAATPPTHPTQ